MEPTSEGPVDPIRGRPPRAGSARVWAWSLGFGVAFVAGPLLAAGTWRWPAFWTTLAVLAVALTVHQGFVARRSPGLLARRMRVGSGTPRWDIAWHFAFWPLVGLVPVVAGLEFRANGARGGTAGIAAGAALLAAGLVLSAHAMACNPFFEGTARLQSDRAQHVVDAGPYRAIRHPGYAGLALCALGTPFLLRSWWAWPAAAAVVASIAIRTALEDRMLRDGLPGYAEYAGRVRHRLLPGVW
jgi:protein-S-isoprenylcysteine O-methyltransferase Ste14